MNALTFLDLWPTLKNTSAPRLSCRKVFRRGYSLPLDNAFGNQILVAEEKGIDVRIALDTIHLAYRNEYDVALMFSQDQDLSEVAEQVRLMAKEQGRWIKMASAFPVSPTSRNRRGINKTDWIPIDRNTYDACLDPRDYRSPRS